MVSGYRGLIGVLLALHFATAGAAWGQTLPLREASARRSSDLRPVHEGQNVIVQGQVAGEAVVTPGQAYLAISGDEWHGLLLEAPEFMFERISPGDRLEVRGVINDRNGQVVLHPVQITTIGHAAPRPPVLRRIQDLQGLSATGTVAAVEARIAALGEDSEGAYLVLDDGQPVPYPVYLTTRGGVRSAGFKRFHVGDRVKVRGIAIVSGSADFRMVIAGDGAVELVSRGWLIAPHNVVLGGAALILGLLWRSWRHRQTETRHRTIRRLNAVSEELAMASTSEEVSRKLAAALPTAMPLSSVRLFRVDRGQQRLVLVEGPHPGEVVPQAEESAVATAFRNRTSLLIPNARRSRLFPPEMEKPTGGMIVMPIHARDELMGVLSLSHPHKVRIPSPEELAALQHAGNQAALTLKAIESVQRKEQLLRSEKLAAAGQLIQGMTGELRAPLESIVTAANRLVDQGTRDARAIVNESLRASAILSRLSMVARGDQEEAQTLDMNHVVARAVEVCRADWEEVDVSLEVQFHPKPIWVLGSASQIGQVIGNLVSLAARAAVETRSPEVKVTCASMARRVTVVIEYPAGFIKSDEEAGALGFEVCRGILQGNGGELKLSTAEQQCRVEIAMPEAFPAVAAPQSCGPHKRLNRALTALLLEPDIALQRRLISVWTGHGHRAMQVANEAEAIELASRLRIDAIFCAVRAGNTNWVEIFERTRERVPTFVLLTEGVDSDESSLFPEGEGLVLRIPLDAGDVGRLLERIEDRVEAFISA